MFEFSTKKFMFLLFLVCALIIGGSHAAGLTDLGAPFQAASDLKQSLSLTGGLAGQATGIRTGVEAQNASLTSAAQEMDGFDD